MFLQPQEQEGPAFSTLCSLFPPSTFRPFSSATFAPLGVAEENGRIPDPLIGQ